MNTPNNTVIPFEPSDPMSIGMELELQLLDATSLDLVDGILSLLELYPDSTNIKPEIIQNTVEVSTDVCHSPTELETQMGGMVHKLQQQCQERGINLCGAGTHPFCKRLALITPLPRYLEMEQSAGYLAHNQITFATHVHLGMQSGDEAIRLMCALKPYLPILLALSANAPFWRGHDTGYASYRQRILAASRSYGIPPTFSSWNDFSDFLVTSQNAGFFNSINDIHWDIRPRPHMGSLEIRVMDAQSSVRDAVALAAFIRALVFFLRETPLSEQPDGLPTPLPWWIEKENYFQASRLGLDACYVMDKKGNTRQLREVIFDIFTAIEKTSVALEQTSYMEHLQQKIKNGLGYEQQRKLYQESQSLKQVVTSLVNTLDDNAETKRATGHHNRPVV